MCEIYKRWPLEILYRRLPLDFDGFPLLLVDGHVPTHVHLIQRIVSLRSQRIISLRVVGRSVHDFDRTSAVQHRLLLCLKVESKLICCARSLTNFACELNAEIYVERIIEIVLLGVYGCGAKVGLLGTFNLSSAPWTLVSLLHLFLHNV
jgi:hypothetical protein